jgi:5-formyltetrahydrofolate cyclo-ligase
MTPHTVISKKEKRLLRTHLKHLRSHISVERKMRTKYDLVMALKNTLSRHRYVLSFSSFGSEIDTSLLNEALLLQGSLILPRMEDHELHLFHVKDASSQLLLNDFGFLEPRPDMCESISPEKISCAFVPGLGFDIYNHRLGYGHGFYDRLLPSMPHCETYGIAFIEQRLTTALPILSTDISLGHCLFF